MSIIVHREVPINVTTLNGGWQSATISKLSGLLRQIIVKSASDGTIFDFYMQDTHQVVIFRREDIDGELNEQVALPVHDRYSIYIENATADEAFTIYLGVQES